MQKKPFNFEGFKDRRFSVRCETEEEAKRFFDFIANNMNEPYEMWFTSSRGNQIGWRNRHKRYGVYYYMFYDRYWNKYYLNATNSPINDFTVKFKQLTLGDEINIDNSMLASILGFAI